MSHIPWWSAQQDKPNPRFWEFWRRQTTAETPFRVEFKVSNPPPTKALNVANPLPASVRSVLCESPIPREASIVGLEPVPERAGQSTRQPVDDWSIASGDALDRPQGPALAERLRALLAVPLESLLPGSSATLEWPGELLPFQLDGVRVLLTSDRILLADDMGLGKTVQAIAAIRILTHQRMIESVLIATPAAIVQQWQREYRRWAPELRTLIIRGPAHDRAWQWNAEVHAAIVSYDTLRSDLGTGAMSAPGRKLWDLVVLDEAQRIKNDDTATSILVKRLGRKRSWAMTGTPLENKIEDLVSILEFVDHVEGSERVVHAPGETLLKRHQDLQLRRRKMDVLKELPAKQIIEINLSLGAGQRATYRRAEEEGIVQLRKRGAAVRVQHVLELITRLKQICNFDSRTGESAKISNISERLEILTEQGHRALVFSQYTDDVFGVAAIARVLQAYNPVTYTGGMSGAGREQVIEDFKTNIAHKVLVLSVRAGGLGLNLQEASYVFHLDRWWNPAVEHQAEDRTHRMGQTVPVTVFKYVCEGTIEERIRNLLAEKQKLYDEVVDDVSFDISSRLSESDLFGLFGLQSPRRSAAKRQTKPTGLELEARCARLLSARGWLVERTPRSRDGGVDLIVSRIDEVGIEQKLYVQCKDWARPVGVDVVRELVGVLPADRGVRPVLAAPMGVTSDAAHEATQRGVRIWDAAMLAALESGD